MHLAPVSGKLTLRIGICSWIAHQWKLIESPPLMESEVVITYYIHNY